MQTFCGCWSRRIALYFRPGSDYRYSNSGYALLALIVERASGRTFATFLRERIFQPLGMSNTVAYEDGISTVSTRAFGYTEEQGRWNRTDQSQTSAVLGDGGIYSSIDDLAKWDAALYDGRLLRPSSLQAAFTPATHTDDSEVEYGFGWRITGETLWHSGRDRRLPQRDRALSETAHDGDRADQPERSGAVQARAANSEAGALGASWVRLQPDFTSFSMNLIAREASNPSARAMCRNSMTSMRRSPPSYFATKLWCLPSLSASACWVIPALSRALTRYWVRRTCSAERKDFKVAGSVSGPVSVIPLCQYPNLGYAVSAEVA